MGIGANRPYFPYGYRRRQQTIQPVAQRPTCLGIPNGVFVKMRYHLQRMNTRIRPTRKGQRYLMAQ
jgi:hypothetical protein